MALNHMLTRQSASLLHNSSAAEHHLSRRLGLPPAPLPPATTKSYFCDSPKNRTAAAFPLKPVNPVRHRGGRRADAGAAACLTQITAGSARCRRLDTFHQLHRQHSNQTEYDFEMTPGRCAAGINSSLRKNLETKSGSSTSVADEQTDAVRL